MPKYPGIPEDLEGTVQLIVATATREATRDFEHKVEAMQADLKVVQSQMDENVKSKKNMEEAKAKADSELVASGNKVVELTAQLDATKKQAETLTAELKAKADALDVIEVDSKIGAKWKEITATFGVPEDQFEARKPLLRKMVAGKENFTGEDMQQLIAGGTGKPAAKPSSLHSLAASSMGGAVPAGTATKEELVKVWGPHIFERRYN